MNAPYAADPARSRGRRYGGGTSGIRGPRDAFQRDRDRIIHSVPFRRLRHKTQVFVAPDGDHFRVRLTHSLEVAQIGRTMARALGLNEDLVEALCLAHDIGHPPFGHSGEDALSAAMTPAGGFDHNAHTLRVLTMLEAPYPLHRGLDLSWETLEGLAKHNGPVAAPNWALRAVDAQFPLDLGSWPSLEAQVAAIADDIAYDNHDIDDGLRAGLFTLDELLTVPLIADQWRQVEKRYPSVAADRLVGELVRDQIGLMVNDVLEESRLRIRGSAVGSITDVHAAGGPLIAFSPGMIEGERRIKSFLYERMYRAPGVRDVADRAKQLLADLFEAYSNSPQLLPTEWQEEWPDDVARLRTIGDFVAGMTDRYAIAQYRYHIGEVTLPEAF